MPSFVIRRSGVRMRLAVFAAAFALAGAAGNVAAKNQEQKFDEYLTAAAQVEHFSGAALVAKDGKIVFAKGYGLADASSAILNAADTRFLIGSLTKQFTAVAILQLAEKKLLKVDDPIGKYLPDYPKPAADKITLQHLLTHTAGIPNYTDLPQYLSIRTLAVRPQDIVAMFKDLPLQFEPGSQWRYSNSGYFLLGLIIEKVSGETYQEYLIRHILEPLAMTNTGYPHGAMVVSSGRATGYTTDSSGATVPAVMPNSSVPFAAGALYATVEDMVKWDEGLRSGAIISQTSHAQMFTPFKEKYGFAWIIDTLYGRQMATHDGAIDGFTSGIVRFLDEPFCVVVFSNNDAFPAGRAAFALTAIACEKPYDLPVQKTPVAIDAQKLDDYVGVYEIDTGLYRIVFRAGDSLFAQRSGSGRRHLFFEGKDKFYYDFNNAVTLTFIRDAGGKVAAQVIHQDGRDERARRVEGEKADKLLAAQAVAAIDPGIYDTYVGEYELAPGFVLTVKRRGDQIFTQATGQQEVEIFPHSQTEFFLKVTDAQISFIKDKSGAVTGLVLHQGGRDLPARKTR